jgi:2-C-methyl-D-erythritol 4-phosphate cytidylyltransferase
MPSDSSTGTCRPGAAAFVVLAGGSGTRVGGDLNKVYLPVAGRPVISWSLAWGAQVPAVGPIVLVARPQDEQLAAHAITAAGLDGRAQIVHGGATRHASEHAALEHLRPAIMDGHLEVVAIHDGARPLAGAALLDAVITAAVRHGGAVPAVPEDHVWPVDADGMLRPGATGSHLFRVQTPQAFRAGPLLAAYLEARASGREGTDTSAALEGRDDVVVVAVHGDPANLKVTFPEDLARASEALTAAAT